MKPFALLLAALSLVGCAGGSGAHDHGPVADVRTVAANSPFRGAWLEQPYRLPTAELRDLNGQTYDWPATGLPAPVTIVFFGYTNCADGFCQTQTADAAAAVRGLSASLAKQVAIVFITTDPARDTPPVLRKFLAYYSAQIVGLTGDFGQIKRAADGLGVEISEPTAPPTAEYEVAHGTQLIGFGPDGTAPVVWLPGTPVADIRADLAVLASGKY